MRWTDDAFVLSARRHGEAGAVVHLLTRRHGRHAGLVRGAASKALRGVVQPGNRVAATWTARLDDQLGVVALELAAAHAAAVLDDAGRLAALSAACALADATLPERQAHPEVFDAFAALVADFAGADWPSSYVRWELVLLAALGYGLDLEACVVTGTTADLTWVSPRTGRAVSAAAGAAHADKLLPLPRFLVAGGAGTAAEVAQGLALTGHFLRRHALAGRAMPAARLRAVDRLGR